MDSHIGEEAEHQGVIPDKRYFKIGEVCEIAGVKQHVLRYWESEFKQLIRPQRASSKQRLYRRVDVENILTIKKLLKEDGFTIPGAKKLFAGKKGGEQKGPPEKSRDARDLLHDLKAELIAIQQILQDE
ncbi:MAG: MerR family transcriptional regulator [Desulfurivibrio sp.]|jgi:DNA-binding transcriptional MerR regulator|nr:MAG: MerR family transcriptional regulator [Desulfurivibrio sp.]